MKFHLSRDTEAHYTPRNMPLLVGTMESAMADFVCGRLQQQRCCFFPKREL